jgi:hypothetical protein
VFESVKAEIALAEKLRRCPKITRYDSPDHDEAGQLAHGFADLEDEAYRLLDALPKLQASDSCESSVDQLLDIGEALRHILYQIRAARFYDYLPSDAEMKS